MNCFHNRDKLVKASVAREDIQMLVKLVEGLGHLGVVTTIEKAEGTVLMQTTKDCWPDLIAAIREMPINVTIPEDQD